MTNAPDGSLHEVCDLLRATNGLLGRLLAVDEKRMQWLLENDRERQAKQRAAEQASATDRSQRWSLAMGTLHDQGFDVARLQLAMLALNYLEQHGQEDILAALDEIIAGKPKEAG